MQDKKNKTKLIYRVAIIKNGGHTLKYHMNQMINCIIFQQLMKIKIQNNRHNDMLNIETL